MTDLITRLRSELPPTFTRQAVGRLLGGIIAPGTLANLDSQKRGPAGRFYNGRVACYERDLFLDWLAARLNDSSTVTPLRRRKGDTE